MLKRRLALAFSLALLVPWAQAQTAGKLRIGVEGAYPPFSEVAPNGQLRGLEIDLARHWCAQMKRECELVKIEFDGLIPALQARKIDAIVASLSITPARQKAIAFSKPYYATPQTFVGRAGAGADIAPAALRGKRIGVQSATINEAYVNALYGQSQVVRYATQDQVYLDLSSGRVDYTLVDSVAAGTFLASPAGKGLTRIGPPLRDPQYFGRGVGVGLRKSDAATLGAAFNAAIDASRTDGSFDRFARQYFPYDISPP